MCIRDSYLDGRCALIYLTRDEIRQSGVDPADLEELTSLPISIEGVKDVYKRQAIIWRWAAPALAAS